LLVFGGVAALALLLHFLEDRLNLGFYTALMGTFSAAFVALMFRFSALLNPLKFTLTSSTAYATISELSPMFYRQGQFTLFRVFGNFGINYFIAVAVLLFLASRAYKKGNEMKLLLVAWASVFFVLSLSHVVFASYLALPLSLLMAYAVSLAGSKKRQLIVVIVLLIALIPSINMNINAAKAMPALSNEWQNSLEWLKANTPDPGIDFYAKYDKATFEYPDEAYGVMNWWPSGHHITYIARRVPISNPFQGNADKSAQYFLSESETGANDMMGQLNSRYVVIDIDVMDLEAMAKWAGSETTYLETHYPTKDGKKVALTLYYPAFYRAMATRLYVFNGQGCQPSDTVYVYIHEDSYNEIRGFESYEEAVEFTYNNPAADIVGISPSECPMPVEALQHYKPLYQEGNVKVFEYIA
jgi:dolichyl-diphosphooligosaccharide--protein glycosyltransferase